jgi:formate hydrogenlyase subunit 3/multisubunit Na+/H+ antiporter MnhD subunit
MSNVVLMIVLPLLGAFLLPLVNRVSTAAGRWLGPAILLLTTLIGLSLWGQLNDAPFVAQMGGFRPPLGIVLYVDQLALLLAIAISLGTLIFWPGGQLESSGSDAGGSDAVKRSTLSLVLAGSGSGIALSGDLFNIYVFYELLAVVSYGLIASRGSAACFAASIRYVIISSIGASMALLGIALIYQATGTLNMAHLAQLAPDKLNNLQGLAAFVLLLIGFGVKAELFPVNAWVAEVYATTSSRVTALLTGVVSKLALVVIVRLLILIFNQSEALQLMLILGVMGIVTGELAAWRARDLNRMLAYSSIGQLGVMFVAFSIPGKAGVFAGLAVALHHMIVKPAFYMLATKWGGSIAKLAGAAKASPLSAALFVLLALSLIGVPPFPGFWVKLLLLTQLVEQADSLYLFAGVAILLAAALEVNYLFRVASSLYQPDDQPSGDPLPVVSAPHGKDLLVASGLVAILLATMVMIVPVSSSVEHIAVQAADSQKYIQTVNLKVLP